MDDGADHGHGHGDVSQWEDDLLAMLLVSCLGVLLDEKLDFILPAARIFHTLGEVQRKGSRARG